MLLKKISDHIRRRRLFYAATDAEHALRAHYRARDRRPAQAVTSPLIAIQGMRLDPFYYSLFGEIVQALRARTPIRVEQCDLFGLRSHAMTSPRALLRAWLVHNPFASRAWERHYAAFCDGVAYRAVGLFGPLREVKIWFQAMGLWRGLKTNADLSALTIRGMPMGDLVIDSYLRFRPTPRLNIDDPYLLVVIRQAIKDVDRAFRYFSARKPNLYITSYLSYVQHGTPARVAASLGIPVFSLLANRQRFSKPVTFDDFAPADQGARYSADFASLPDQAARMAIGEASLQGRVSGKRDMTNADMKTSQYEIKTTDVPDVRNAVIVFLHDFYDAPHDAQWMVYTDFWEWACSTIEILQNANLPFYIKPHPTQRSDSDAEVARMKALYPDCRFLSPDITNSQLVDSGMSCAVTVYGSVAAEMGFMGVPTIAAGDNAYIGFDFCRTARTPDEYRQLLENYREFRIDKDEARRQASSFQYMYLFNLPAEDLALRDTALTLRSAIHNQISAGDPLSPQSILDGLRSVTELPGFARFIDTLMTALTVNHQAGATPPVAGNENHPVPHAVNS